MENQLKIISKSIEDTEFIAKSTAEILYPKGGLICLFGDIGAGKTVFTSKFAKSIAVKEKVTSPSFVILNEYHSGKLPLYHFDLYRLEEAGLNSIVDELREYSQKDNSFTLVEWAEFSQNELLLYRLEIKINYIDEFSREFIITNQNILSDSKFKKLKEILNEHFID